MLHLIITILLVTSFFILFRFFSIFRINAFHAITVNYATATITGLLVTGPSKITAINFTSLWFWIAVILGWLFLQTFFLMSETVNKVSVTVSSIANKTSLVIPVFASLFIFPAEAKEFTLYNYIGIALSIPAIILASIKSKENDNNFKASLKRFTLPFLVFFLGGIIDTLINFSNFKFGSEPGFILFPVTAFFSAAITGFIIIGLKGEKISWRSIAGGILLGIPNYFSIHYLLVSLEEYNNDGALVFPVLNTGIIILTSTLAAILFREKLSLVNISGIILAIISIALIFA